MRKAVQKTASNLLAFALIFMLLLSGCSIQTPEQAQKDAELAAQAAAAANGAEVKGEPASGGMPGPSEPQNSAIDPNKSYACTLYIECGSVLNNTDKLAPNKARVVPASGVIYGQQTVSFYEGESVFDVLLREMQRNGIQMEYVNTPGYNSGYIRGIGNLYELDCGELSGWQFSVNGWSPNYGPSRYQLQSGDRIVWHYTCNLGQDWG